MPCTHKFVHDLYLENIDFQTTTLIIGTFNPAWENLGNAAEWFYGRTRNNYFWEVLPRLYGEHSLRLALPCDWKTFCKTHRIALTDLIASIDDADPTNPDHIDYLKNYRDDLLAKHFKEFRFVKLPDLVGQHPTITQVYLTRSISGPYWRRLWQPFDDYCKKHEIKAKTLLTPSGGARFQISKDEDISLGDFIFQQWQAKWHSI